jgi:HPt (histidine-containing phosphotransfer) domain-containing protein
MSQASQIADVHYDGSLPVMDREQIDMLLLSDEGDAGSDSDTSLACELYQLFEAEGSTKLGQLSAVCARGETTALRDIVHFIAGSAGNLGLARLCAFYRAIECAIEEKSLTDISACEAPIRREFEYAREAFRAEFNL